MLARLLPVLLLTSATCVSQTVFRVRDPNASFIDVAARRTGLASAKTPRLRSALSEVPACAISPAPASPPRGQGIPPHYLHDSHGPVSPAEHTASQPYESLQRVASCAAERYLVTGDSSVAQDLVKMRSQTALPAA